MKRQLLAATLGLTGMTTLLARLPFRPRLVALNYHRIGDGSASPCDRGLWSADADAFDAQLRFVKRNFDVIVASDLPDVLARGKGRYAIVTFDDGYRDNHDIAFPILRSHGLRAVFFVATGFIDHPNLPWWDEIAWMVRRSERGRIDMTPWIPAPIAFDEPDRERAIQALLLCYKKMAQEQTADFINAIARETGSGRAPAGVADSFWMDWDMLRAMAAAGMEIGGHSVHHPVLSKMSRPAQWQEISGCLQRITDQLGQPVRSFSYPVGGRDEFNQDTRDCLRELGIAFAFTYYGGHCTLRNWDPYDMPRIAIEPYMTKHWFRSVLTLPELFARPRVAAR